MTDEYRNACTEVYTILSYLNEEEYSKISPNVIKVIKENRNMEYIFDIDWDIELKEQKLLTETRAILFNIFRDYLATPEQKEKIINMQEKERQENELKKREKYNSDIFQNKKVYRKEENIQKIENDNNKDMIVYKENFFSKIINKIKRIFKYDI